MFEFNLNEIYLVMVKVQTILHVTKLIVHF